MMMQANRWPLLGVILEQEDLHPLQRPRASFGILVLLGSSPLLGVLEHHLELRDHRSSLLLPEVPCSEVLACASTGEDSASIPGQHFHSSVAGNMFCSDVVHPNHLGAMDIPS